LAAAGWRPPRRSVIAAVLFPGAILFNMLLLSPVCHLHYFCLMIPLAMGLMAAAWERTPSRLGAPLAPLLTAHTLAGLRPTVPGLDVLRDLGLAACGALLLWAVGCVVLWKQTRER